MPVLEMGFDRIVSALTSAPPHRHSYRGTDQLDAGIERMDTTDGEMLYVAAGRWSMTSLPDASVVRTMLPYSESKTTFAPASGI